MEQGGIAKPVSGVITPAAQGCKLLFFHTSDCASVDKKLPNPLEYDIIIVFLKIAGDYQDEI